MTKESIYTKDSVVGDTWIADMMKANPVQRIYNPTTGAYTGDILTGPVRLAFVDILELPKPVQGQTSTPKYGTQLLFPVGQDLSVLYEDYNDMCAQHFRDNFSAGKYHGVHVPFRDQAEKLKFGGFKAGGMFMSCSSQYKPPVVDTRRNPIVDASKVYPGVWAICAIKAYVFGKSPPQPKKGISYGLQSVMIITDDTKFGTGGADVNTQFGSVDVKSPIVRPSSLPVNPQGFVPQKHGSQELNDLLG
jgi:hypothetical protein